MIAPRTPSPRGPSRGRGGVGTLVGVIPRSTQRLVVASVALSAATTLGLSLAALLPALRASVPAAQLLLALSALTALATAPLPDPRCEPADRLLSHGVYLLFSVFRVLGVAVALGRGTLDEARVQLLLAMLFQPFFLAAGISRARGLLAALVAVVAFALLGGALDRSGIPALLPLAWFSLTLTRWVQSEMFLQRALPVTDHGRLAPWRHPSALALPLELIANSRTMQLLLEPLPVPEMRSDITEVVYVNYLVEADRLAHFVPEGLALQRLGPDGRYALFTFLTYRHGHFGFSLLGPLRRALPSPVQTNWRVHVVDPRTGRQGIRFVTNAIDQTLPALAARLLSEGMPMHVLRRASLTREDDGSVQLALDPGGGSAPDAQAILWPASRSAGVYRESAWQDPWPACFADLRAFLEYCVPQDRAMDAQPWRGRISRQEIHLGIPIDACVPLVGEVTSEAARRIVGDAKPVCFLVPGVAFRFRVEAYDPIAPRAS